MSKKKNCGRKYNDGGAHTAMTDIQPDREALERLAPRCKTTDKQEFPEVTGDERCFNCRLWEAIDADRQAQRSRICREIHEKAPANKPLKVGEGTLTSNTILVIQNEQNDKWKAAIEEVERNG